MIEIIVSDSCPHCETQLEVMTKSFFEDEYKIIKVGSPDFENDYLRALVDAVPFVIIRDEVGKVQYAGKGIHDGTSLRRIERGAITASEVCIDKLRSFNISKVAS